MNRRAPRPHGLKFGKRTGKLNLGRFAYTASDPESIARKFHVKEDLSPAERAAISKHLAEVGAVVVPTGVISDTTGLHLYNFGEAVEDAPAVMRRKDI